MFDASVQRFASEDGTDPSPGTRGEATPEPLAEEPTLEPADVWAEAFSDSRVAVRAGDWEYPVVVNGQVQLFLDLFTGNRREVVSLWVSRSGHYMDMIREIFRSKGVPEDLAYTAMIESGFNPVAVSRAGAKGLWQFMAGTARRYGLRVDHWVDERFDPDKSTVAAAAYLRDLHTLFGSWSLAQAAYNAGEVKVSRAIRLTGSNDFWTLAASRHLRRETKEFVPQIHAATLIGRDPARYGFEFPDTPRPRHDVVAVPASTDVRKLSAASGIPVATLQRLNPVLVRGITPPGRSWELRVPAGSQSVVLAALAPPRARIAKARSAKTARVAAHGPGIHVVRPQDTVSSIAKRYGVSVRDVLRWNSLERSARIRPGDRLRVAESRHFAEREGQGGFR